MNFTEQRLAELLIAYDYPDKKAAAAAIMRRIEADERKVEKALADAEPMIVKQIKQHLGKIQAELIAVSQTYNAAYETLQEELAELQERCPHPASHRKAGCEGPGEPVWVECTLCGKELE